MTRITATVIGLSALIWLTGCVPEPVVRVQTLEIPVPVMQPIPMRRIEPIPRPKLRAGEITLRDLVEHAHDLHDALDLCDADRAWLEGRQKGPISE